MSESLPGAQAHIAAALERCAKIDDLPAGTPLIPIRKVGVIGAGTMGGGIAMNFLSAGIAVTIVEQEQAALDRGVGVMGRNYEASVKRGRIEAAEARAAMDRLTPSLSFADLAGFGDFVHQYCSEEHTAQGYQLLLSRVHGRLPLLDQGSATSITPPPRQTSPS